MKKVFVILLSILLMCGGIAYASSIVKVVPRGATDGNVWQGLPLQETDVYLADAPFDKISNSGADPYVFRTGATIYSQAISVANASDFNWAMVVRNVEDGGAITSIDYEVSYDGGQNFIQPSSSIFPENRANHGASFGSTFTNFTGVRADYIRFVMEVTAETHATVEFIYQKD